MKRDPRCQDITPEALYLSRRAWIAGVTTAALAACGGPSSAEVAATLPPADRHYPAGRNTQYTGGRPMTDEIVAASHNNFYEFTSSKNVWKYAQALPLERWSVEVAGLVAKPRRYSIDDLLRLMPLEERVYRFRCVEAWAMVIPWTGFPLASLLRASEPSHAARFVRFVSFADSSIQNGVRRRQSAPWPYSEGLRIDEAMHELAFMATGIYGHPLPKQHGAPIRLVVPWKYGYKSAKSVVRIELVAEQPRTFWETLAPVEYPFESNVDPRRPHPRWSQATERLIGTWDVRRTLLYNGYGSLVAPLYE